MTESTRFTPLRIVIVGGGIGAVETVLALHDLAGPRLHVTLIAPEPDFILRPLAVAGPFGRGHADVLPLSRVMADNGGRFIRGSVLRVDAAARTVTLATGAEVAYDMLVLALGASAVPAFTRGLTFGDNPLALNGILADLEQGWSRSVAFVVPGACTWPLPLYELALMTAEQTWSMNMDGVELHFVTPELEPLEIFGAEASTAIAEMLGAAHITTHFGVNANVTRDGCVETGTGPDLVVDRIVALPVLEGATLVGIPSNAEGFIAVDDAGLVDGLDSVYAVGDVTDRPIKQGGLACQQADVTAAHIAERAGADVIVPPLEQVLRGRLLSGRRDRFLQRDTAETEGGASTEPLWWPPAKVSGKYLSPYLVAKDFVHLPTVHDLPTVHEEGPAPGIDICVPLTWQQKLVDPDILGLSPLGPIVRR